MLDFIVKEYNDSEFDVEDVLVPFAQAVAERRIAAKILETSFFIFL